VTLTPANGSDLGFDDGDFDALIRLEPSGTVFTDPVIVVPSDQAQSPLLFAGTSGPVPAEGMPYNAASGGYELSHFSWIGFSGYWCDTSQEWSSDVDPLWCMDEGVNSEDRHLDCVAKKFCITVTEDCCVDPDAQIGQGCGYSQSTSAYNRVVTRSNDTNGGQYPYCDLSSLFDAGGDGLSCDEAFASVDNDGGFAVAYRCTDTLSPAWMDGDCEGGIPVGMSCDEFCSLTGLPCRGATFLDRGACNGGGTAFGSTCSENGFDIYCSCGTPAGG
jgi:hypothetical protein